MSLDPTMVTPAPPSLLGLGPITTPFGGPSAFTGKPHEGVDIGVASGTEIREPVGGRFVGVTQDPIGGLQAIVQTASGFREVFAHLSSVVGFKSGDIVKPGDVIATSGASGLVTGAHLHYEVRSPQGRATDPLAFLGEFGPQSGPPVDDETKRKITDKLHELAGRVQGSFGYYTEAQAAADLRAAFPSVPLPALRQIVYGAQPFPEAPSNDVLRNVPLLGGIAGQLADVAQGKPNPLDVIAKELGDLTKPQTWAKLGFTIAAVAVVGAGLLFYAGGMKVATPPPVSIGAA